MLRQLSPVQEYKNTLIPMGLTKALNAKHVGPSYISLGRMESTCASNSTSSCVGLHNVRSLTNLSSSKNLLPFQKLSSVSLVSSLWTSLSSCELSCLWNISRFPKA